MRWFLRLAFALAAIVALAIGAVALVPAERIAGLVTQEVSARTGRDFFILGKVRPAFFPVLGVRVGDIRFGNAEWGRQETMLSAESLLIGVELIPLLKGDIRIRDFRLRNPVLNLERNADGRGNWELAPPREDAPGTGGGAAPAFSLADGRISGARIAYSDRASGQEIRINGLDLALSLPEIRGPLTFSGAFGYRGARLDFSGAIADLGAFLQGGLGDVSLELGSGFAGLSVVGLAGLDPPAADLRLEARISDMAQALALAGQAGAVPLKSAALSGRLTLAESGALFLRDGRLGLDDQGLDVELDLVPAPRARLTARITAGALVLPGPAGGEAADGAAGDGWSEAPLDLSALRLMDADIGFAAQSLRLGPLRLGATALRARLERGRLVIGLNGIDAYQGRISGEYVINARGALSMGGDLVARELQLLPLLNDVAGYDRLDAAASGRVKFLTSGDSVAALMRRMSGSGRLDIGAGEMIGLDIAGMLRNLDASYRGEGSKTIFDSISGSFTIKGGVLTNDDLKFESPLVFATGAGEADLAERTLAYRLTPTAFGGRSLSEAGGISVPVLISGRWDDLGFRPDLGGLFDAGLEKQRADLERAAREAEQKLRGDAERALQEGVEKTLGDVLKRALGQQ